MIQLMDGLHWTSDLSHFDVQDDPEMSVKKEAETTEPILINDDDDICANTPINQERKRGIFHMNLHMI